MSRPSFPDDRADWLTVPEALDRILESAAPLPSAELPLEEALGRVLARDVHARFTLPPWDNAGMDGYALRSSDFPGDGSTFSLPVDGEVTAGESQVDAPAPGRAVRIMTGAPVPRGLDTVVRVEDTDREEGEAGQVEIRNDRDRGGNVRPGGEDMARGDLLLSAGTPVSPGRVALLASAALDPVAVVRPPRVVLLPTGDELRRPADFSEADAGRAIPESNGPALRAICAALRLPTLLLPPVPDDREALRAAIRRAGREGDVLVTLGGASMGTADLVKDVLAEEGFQLDFWRVRMRPGSPFSFGHLPAEGRLLPVFGLPGNPASSFVTFQLLVRPFLARQAGFRDVHRPVVPARAGTAFGGHPERALFPRVVLEVDENGDLRALPAGAQGSGLVQTLGRAHGLAVVPPGDGVDAGSEVDVIVLDDGPGGSPTASYAGRLARLADAAPGPGAPPTAPRED